MVIAEKGLTVKDGDCKVEILSPGDKKYNDINHYSIVSKITYKDTSFILTGDAEKVNEKDRELQSAQFQLSQLSQNATIINALRPTPIPAYLTCSPFTSYGGNGCGCGCGGYAA